MIDIFIRHGVCMYCELPIHADGRAPIHTDSECDRARAAGYREANRELINQRARITQFRRHRFMEVAAVAFTLEQLDQRMAYYGYTCWICKDAPFEHLDHVKPVSKGGSHMLCNLRPACASCNLRKSAKWPFNPLDILEAA